MEITLICIVLNKQPLSVMAPDVLETLIDWAVEGLDLGAAIAQPETAYKVRHLKMGVRLSGALCCCNSDITVQLMVSMSIFCQCWFCIFKKKNVSTNFCRLCSVFN